MITVRLFAAAADAAGAESVALAPTELADVAAPGDSVSVADVSAALAKRYGGELSRVLERCSVLVDGVRADAETIVPSGATVDVLPPFAGG